MLKPIQKIFIAGDEWLYYKLYCGVQTADRLLTEVIQGLTEELLAQKKIKKWFFIRYSDPDPHLRVRFYLDNVEELGNIMKIIKNRLFPFIKNKQLWDVQVATYQREIERYGVNTIEKAESFFFCDSQQALSIIQQTKEGTMRFLQVFQWIEQIISLFKLETQKQLSFLDRMQQQFKEEFKINKDVKKTLSKKYRTLESQLFKNSSREFSKKILIENNIDQLLLLDKEKQLDVSLENLLASYIHISINRNFASQQRLYEMMLYDFLYRKNKSKFVRYGRL